MTREALRRVAMEIPPARSGGRIVAVACPARKLVIALDGGQYDKRCAADALRSAAIDAHGYRVVRFWNNEVMENLDGVLQSVRAALDNPPPHPSSLRPPLCCSGGRSGD